MKHGTINGYKKHKCRCGDCKKANRTYQQEYRQFMKQEQKAEVERHTFLSRLIDQQQQHHIIKRLSNKVVGNYYSKLLAVKELHTNA